MMRQSALLTLAVVILAVGTAFARQASEGRQSPPPGLQPKGKDTPAKGNAGSWALLVGVGDYDDPAIHNLQYADDDARALGDALVEKAGFPPDQVALRTSKQNFGGSRATRSDVLKALDDLDRFVGPESTFLFYFSGHGTTRNGQHYLMCADTNPARIADTALPMDAVLDRLRKATPRRIILIIDACRPGNAGGTTDRLNVGTLVTSLRDEAVASKTAWALLFSCSPGELSYEDDVHKHGAFTYHLLEGLGGAAWESALGRLTVENLADHARRQVVEWSGPKALKQTPYSEIVKHGEPLFELARTQPAPAPPGGAGGGPATPRRDDPPRPDVLRVGPGEVFVRIGDALSVARPGQRIEVMPGAPYTESLVMRQGVELIALADGVVVQMANAPVLDVQTATPGSLRGFTLRELPGASGAHCVDVARGQITLDRCTIESGGGSCLAVHGTDARAKLIDSHVRNGAFSGVSAFDGGSVNIIGGEIAGCSHANVRIDGAGPLNQITRCAILRGGQNGVLIVHGGKLAISEATISANHDANVEVAETTSSGRPRGELERQRAGPSTVSLVDCQILDGKSSGVWAYEGTDARLERCVVRGNGRDLKGADRDKHAGVSAQGGAHIIVAGGTLEQNTPVSLRAMGRETQIEVSGANVRRTDKEEQRGGRVTFR